LCVSASLDKAVPAFCLEFPDIKLVLITDGPGGSYAYYGDGLEHVYQPAVLTADTIDTTGAGDAFFGCCINFLLDNGFNSLSISIPKEKLSDMLKEANAVASSVTAKKGALKAIFESATAGCVRF
jgi:fructokinase